MPRAKAEPQTAMDEIVLEDQEAEDALEAYQRAREDATKVEG